jgi:hypothetical protein
MAVEQTRIAYQRLYGVRPSRASFELLSARELEALAERMVHQSYAGTDHVAILGYN